MDYIYKDKEPVTKDDLKSVVERVLQIERDIAEIQRILTKKLKKSNYSKS